LFVPGALAAEDFDPALFRQPRVDFYPSVFWNWNDKMDQSRIREQLKDMHAHKLFTVCIMPMPRDFRPDSTGNHLDVDYLSDEYFSRYRFAMDEVKRLGEIGVDRALVGMPIRSFTEDELTRFKDEVMTRI